MILKREEKNSTTTRLKVIAKPKAHEFSKKLDKNENINLFFDSQSYIKLKSSLVFTRTYDPPRNYSTNQSANIAKTAV